MPPFDLSTFLLMAMVIVMTVNMSLNNKWAKLKKENHMQHCTWHPQKLFAHPWATKKNARIVSIQTSTTSLITPIIFFLLYEVGKVAAKWKRDLSIVAMLQVRFGECIMLLYEHLYQCCVATIGLDSILWKSCKWWPYEGEARETLYWGSMVVC